MTDVAASVRSRLFAAQDVAYGDFTASLIPDIERERIIGVRAPRIGELARELRRQGTAEAFMAALPHRYHEENSLHACLLSTEKDYDRLMGALEAFLPYVDNWAVCDTLRPAAFKKHPPVLPKAISGWLRSDRTYTVRFGIGTLMAFYLDGAFEEKYLDWVASVKSGEYYVDMMIAWYFATALAKQYDAAVVFLREDRLDPRCHNKTIQKAVESRRIGDERKAFLKTLRKNRRA